MNVGDFLKRIEKYPEWSLVFVKDKDAISVVESDKDKAEIYIRHVNHGYYENTHKGFLVHEIIKLWEEMDKEPSAKVLLWFNPKAMVSTYPEPVLVRDIELKDGLRLTIS